MAASAPDPNPDPNPDTDSDASTETVPRILARPLGRPVLTLFIALVVAGLAAGSASRLRPDSAMQLVFGSDAPSAVALGHVVADFPTADELLLVATADDACADPVSDLLDFATRLADTIVDDADLAADVASVTWSDGPAGGSDALLEALAPSLLLYLDDAAFATALDRLTPDGMRRQIARNESLIAAPGPAADVIARRVLRDPLRLNELLGAGTGAPALEGGPQVSEDGRSLLIRVRGTVPVDDLAFCHRLVTGVERAVAAVAAQRITVEMSGAYAIATLSERSIRRDMIVSVVCTIILLHVLFLVAYRSFVRFLIAMGSVALGILVGFGAFALVRTTLNPATAVIGAVLAGLGIDYAIHVMSHERTGSAADGQTRVRRALAHAARPVTIAAITSMIGFLALSQSSVQALRDFGLLGVLGLAGALVAALTVLPALLVLLGRVRPPRPGRATRTERLIPVTARRRTITMTATLVAWCGAALVAVFSGAFLPTNGDLGAMHPRPNRPLELQAELPARFGAPGDTVLVLLEAENEDDLVGRAWDVRRAVQGAPSILDTASIASFLPDPAVARRRLDRLHALDAVAIERDFRAAVDASVFDPAAYDDYARFLRSVVSQREAPGLATLRDRALDLGGLLPRDPDGDATVQRALAVIQTTEPLAQRAARAEIIADVEARLQGVPGATVTGLATIGAHLDETLPGELAVLLSVAAACVGAFLLVVLRSVRDVGLVLIPTAFGLTIVLAFLHLTGVRLDVISLVGLPLLIGIGVDDGILIVTIAAGARRRGRRAADVRGPLAASCHAVIVTSATTILAFGSLVFTSTPAIRTLGLVTAVGVAACLVATLFLLVPILLRGDDGAMTP